MDKREAASIILDCISRRVVLPWDDCQAVAAAVDDALEEIDRRRQDAAAFHLGLRTDYALRRRISLFLAADYGGELYGDSTSAHRARIVCGIAF